MQYKNTHIKYKKHMILLNFKVIEIPILTRDLSWLQTSTNILYGKEQ